MASAAQARDHARDRPGLFAWLWAVSGRAQVRLALMAMLVFPLSMAPLELQRRIINQAIGDQNLRLLLWLGAAYLGVVLLQGTLKLILQIDRARTGELAVGRMRRRIVGSALDTARGERPPGDPAEGQVVPMVASEVEKVGGFVGLSFSEPLLRGGVLLAILGYMLVVEPLVALASLGFFLPQIVLVPLLQRRMNRYAGRKVHLVRELGERIADRELCVRHGEEHEDHVAQIYANRIAYFRIKFVLKFLTNLCNHLAPLAVLVIGGWFVIEGRSDVGTVVAFISGFERMADPARQLLAHYRLASETRVRYRLLADQFRL